METVLLVRYGELHLKGLNRPFFERKLIEAMRRALRGTSARVERAQGRLFVTGLSAGELSEAAERLQKVFGIYSLSPALCTEPRWESVSEAAELVMREACGDKPATFKVEARRADKRFPMNSMTICRELGAQLLAKFPVLTVDVHTPEIRLGVEIRERAYVYAGETLCAGGLPTGTNGRAALLLSGGIDSPVAGYMIAKRGVELVGVHFHSFPYTSERAKDKVVQLSSKLAAYTGGIKLFVVPFTDIQRAIYDSCPESHLTILMRRMMMRISERIARDNGADALVTGESVGQVASQTLSGLSATDAVVDMPVFRPCIGMDKSEIISYARRIGTYETSILPYEDCCTIFTPRHPVTHPRIKDMLASEALFDYAQLLDAAIAGAECIEV